MKSTLLALTLLFLTFSLFSQNPNLTEDSEISILTFGAGTNLNDAFGHNGIRVKTPYVDIVYDYGRFDFNAPNFYTNFAKGKLLYWQGVSNYRDVIPFYKSQNRSIKEQVLQLSTEEKRTFYTFLITNSKPENREYLYDFFYDNCATKIRDVTQNVTTETIIYKEFKTEEAKTFRDLIQENLKWNTWGSFGIDVALGSVIDQKAAPYNYMFLPKYIHSFFETATYEKSKTPLVKSSRTIYAKKETENSGSFFTSPLFVFLLLGIGIIFITYRDYKNKRRTVWLDVTIFSSTGIIGVLLLWLWFGTNHTTTAHNYNLLWACPLSLPFIFQLLKATPKNWFRGYLKFLVVMLCLMVLHWCVGVQRFAPVLIPIVIALFLRYVFLIKTWKAV
ncbi:lipoprotein N-acyltransferase Lnb domain-containing protein [Lacinutrix salivirga]